MSSFPVVEFDVLVENGERDNLHPGNRHFLELVKTNFRAYFNHTTRERKKEIVVAIIDIIHGRGGRFVMSDIPYILTDFLVLGDIEASKFVETHFQRSITVWRDRQRETLD